MRCCTAPEWYRWGVTARYPGPTVRCMNDLTPADSELALAVLMLVLFLIAMALILPRLTRGARPR
jgi:hypothetical protein